jgi:hypothetical protein
VWLKNKCADWRFQPSLLFCTQKLSVSAHLTILDATGSIADRLLCCGERRDGSTVPIGDHRRHSSSPPENCQSTHPLTIADAMSSIAEGLLRRSATSVRAKADVGPLWIRAVDLAAGGSKAELDGLASCAR